MFEPLPTVSVTIRVSVDAMAFSHVVNPGPWFKNKVLYLHSSFYEFNK